MSRNIVIDVDNLFERIQNLESDAKKINQKEFLV